ncbi:UNVERIFIED_CONTAM: hypothetical protein GTU68_002083 [Idotea baltica]|nr:hypothetical protein [Idotea baltica]
MLEVRGLSVSLGGNTCVDNVSFKAAAGELLAVIGPNGAGKSTLLKLITGELKSSEGQVLIGDTARRDWQRQKLAQQMAVMGQTSRLSFDFTVGELVALGRSPYRLTDSSQQKEMIVEQAIALAGLTHFQQRSVLSLSGGERQRAFFAKTVAQLMTSSVLDEPTSALDLSQQSRVMGAARRIANAGGTVIIVLHDLNLAASFADKIAVLVKGQLVAIDEPSKVLKAENLSNWYACPVCVTQSKESNSQVISLAN